MTALPSLLFPDTSIGFVVTAAIVCLAMAATVATLMRQAELSEGRPQVACLALIVVVAGIGVWTTHFIAVLGYRPDALLSYDLPSTLVSAAIGLLCIGGPLAASCRIRARTPRALPGGLAGCGVAAMHFSGMRALEGCAVAYGGWHTSVAVAIGVVCFAAGVVVAGRRAFLLRTGLLFVGVCALHFTAMAGVTLERVAGVATQGTIDTHLLSALVATASLALSVIACGSILATRRLRDERHIAAESEARQNRMFSLAMRYMSNGLVMVGRDGTIIAFNARAEELLGLEAGALGFGRPFADILVRLSRDEDWDTDQTLRLLASDPEGGHLEAKFASGRILRISSRPLPESGAVLTFNDLTDRYTAERAMTQMTYRDALTGLPNRRSFLEELTRSIAAGRRNAVILLDLDRFKAINETLGHQTGDKLLVKVADRLAETLEEDQLFRLGGDELAVLPAVDADAVASAQALIESFEEPFCVEGRRIRIGCSAGLALAEPGDDADLLLQKADLALYRAKGLGRHRVASYEEGMMESARERRDLEVDLALANERGELRLVYQPIFRLPERRLVGFEALIRWNHPVRGAVSPADFIPLAEDNGSIVEIGNWVLDTTCRQLSRWPEHIHVAANVSAVQMRRPDIVEQISAALARHGVPATRLELELTETAMVQDGERIAASLSALRRLGVKISMDDFGTGYSSFAHLRAFELDRIKIDRSFVGVTDRDAEARAVVRAVTGMAREMAVMTVGEGVETSEQLDCLVALGCDHAQGHFLGHALDTDAAGRLIAMQSFDDDAQAERGAQPRNVGGKGAAERRSA